MPIAAPAKTRLAHPLVRVAASRPVRRARQQAKRNQLASNQSNTQIQDRDTENRALTRELRALRLEYQHVAMERDLVLDDRTVLAGQVKEFGKLLEQLRVTRLEQEARTAERERLFQQELLQARSMNAVLLQLLEDKISEFEEMHRQPKAKTRPIRPVTAKPSWVKRLWYAIVGRPAQSESVHVSQQ